jgi:hypothetical protein
VTSPDTGPPARSAPEAAVPVAPTPGREPVRPEQSHEPVLPEPAPEPALPEQSREDTDAGWGEYPEPADDRLYRDRPPHWDDC